MSLISRERGKASCSRMSVHLIFHDNKDGAIEFVLSSYFRGERDAS